MNRRWILILSRVLCVDHVCGFEDIRVCGFTQDRGDVFDWTRQNHLTQNPKRSVNTGPDTDRSGTKEGKNTQQSFSAHYSNLKRNSFLFNSDVFYSTFSNSKIIPKYLYFIKTILYIIIIYFVKASAL